MPITISLSVHDIVDVLLRRGHLDTRVFNQASMLEGTLLHAQYQKEQGSDYLSEYALQYSFACNDYIFAVNGKADGVIIDKNGDVTVEEIKTTVADLQDFYHTHGEWHMGQAMFYAYILAKQRNRNDITVLLTYIKQGNYHQHIQIRKNYSLDELESFVNGLITHYAEYMKKIARLKMERDDSCKDLAFPYPELRPGQEEIISFVRKACDEKEEVYLEAPTGIGKTIATLYPMVSLFGKRKADLVFYLTSKNSIKKIAMDAMRRFIEEGCKAKAIEFSAQETICLNDKCGHCNPDECPFARNYYDKLLEAVFDCLYTKDYFDRKTLIDFCMEKRMCPFQFQMDLGLYCDVLVCDYSYVFDYHDRLGLKEDLLSKKRAYLLIDECHNVPDRVRDMYSIEIDKASFEKAKHYCFSSTQVALKYDIERAQKEFSRITFDPEDENVKKEDIFILENIPEAFLSALNTVITDFKEIFRKHPSTLSDPLLEFFYTINSFYFLVSMTQDEEYGRTFLTYLRIEEGETNSIRIANLDSTPLIKSGIEGFKSTVFFSATLSPKDYYIDLLGGRADETEKILILPSPFKKENRKIFVDTSLSLRFRDRKESMENVYQEVKTAISQKKGNYFVFCPSFLYLEELKEKFLNDEMPLSLELYSQTRQMKEEEREEFLSYFAAENEETTVGLVVIGGVFSEGIDLIGDRLIGAIVISVGLPQIGFERDQLKSYYDRIDESEKKGFSYAYSYPGLNRVLQAAGRVIRSETDKGFILFIDSRFRQPLYQKIIRELYPDYTRVISLSQLKAQLRWFWKEKK